MVGEGGQHLKQATRSRRECFVTRLKLKCLSRSGLGQARALTSKRLLSGRVFDKCSVLVASIQLKR
jgi:hypothetical protein